MKDVAIRAGVAQQTVSKILNNTRNQEFSTTTRDRVLKIVKELNYHPNYLASSLRSGKRMCIGICGTSSLGTMNDPYASSIYSGIGKIADKNEYNLTFIPLGKAGFDESLKKTAGSKMVDGIIIIVYSSGYEHFKNITLKTLDQIEIPFVAIHPTSLSLNCNNVGFDSLKSGVIATQHLLELGYKDIHSFSCSGQASQDFLKGYQSTMEQSGNAATTTPIKSLLFTAREGYEYAQQHLRYNKIHDSYVFYSDGFARGFRKALTDRGLNVPADVAIVGCGNYYDDLFLIPDLTTVDVKNMEKGQRASEILFKQIEEKETSVKDYTAIILEPQLIVRESSVRKL